ncbi:hypothetical protein [Silvanigrella aquatica]|uniref:Uncharacterized protein n=1 Tax=Silvanigrella aquatica TaxID=1915309 RepID=A0A1L4CYW2_9BACT|nr:hypothetical protein [Silvanigrella aquatica]APJ03153.1 hypothetical protein AXG55_04230 [Silvanigrella aquatica]
MTQIKKIYNSQFELYLKKHFPEHARRILQARGNANLVRFFYPLLSFLIPVVFFASLALVITFLKATIVSSVENGKLSEVINNTSVQTIVAAICGIGIIFAFMSFIIGLLLGFAKARDLLFQAEQLEAEMRHIWLAENISSNQHESEA